MANNTVQSKSQLARLMATENIIVEHKKVSTASFDMKNRVLTCPILKEMGGDLYDLFMGHEVGHALETPLDGWHDAICDKGKNYKHFLNIIEDARIEKKICRRYPGLKKSFISAYNNLLERDFFGTKQLDTDKFLLIDKINLHFKCGVSSGMKFNEEEMVFVNEVEKCETWNDVITVTDKLFAYCKQEKQDKNKQKNKIDSQDGEQSGDFEQSDELEQFNDFEQSDELEQPKDVEQESDESGEPDEKESEEPSTTIEREKESKDYESDDEEPTSVTDESFRKNEHLLIDEKSKPYVYVTIPKPNFHKIITPQKRVNELLDEYYSKTTKTKELNEFKRKNKNYIDLLAKEFEMKKAATVFAKRKISSSGDIDISKIYKYKTDDSIFRKVTKVPNGKSHGLVILLDRSYSMMKSINGAIEQIMILASFCRKVNIPFVVYGFGNDLKGKMIDFPDNVGIISDNFETTKGNLSFGGLSLREYLNSEMSNTQYTNALSNLAALKSAYEEGIQHVPSSERLSNTPLNETMVAMKYIVEEFKNKKNLDIVNLAIVQDGDADHINVYYNESGKTEQINGYQSNYIVNDPKSKLNYKLEVTEKRIYTLREKIFEWFRDCTNVKVFGFYIIPDSTTILKRTIREKYYKNGKLVIREWKDRELVTDIVKKLRKEKFMISEYPGYDKFFFILGGKSLVTEYDELDIEEGASIRKLKTAFSKMNNNKKINRVLVTQFIDGISR